MAEKKKAKVPQTTKSKQKTTDKIMNVAKIHGLPKTVQDSIPYKGIMNNGIIETAGGNFSKTFQLEDLNFSIAQDEEQGAIFQAYMDLLNSFDTNTRWQVNIINHAIDKRTTMEEMRIPPRRDGLNKYRQEKNRIFLKNISEGKNSIVQSKYLTVSVKDDNVEHAVASLQRIEVETIRSLRRLGLQNPKSMSTRERLSLLHEIYNQSTSCPFFNDYSGKDKTFNFDYLEKMGLCTKDVVGPDGGFEFHPNYFTMGDTYGQALYLESVPTFLTTEFLADISDISCNMLLSINYETMESDKAAKMVRNQLSSIEAQISKLQQKQALDGTSGLLPPPLEHAQQNARELMSDITSRNQKIFFTTLTVVVFADDSETLKENVSLIKSIAAKHICPLKNLKYQQEFGLNSSLPLCINDLFAEFMCTTESGSVFIPFTSQELNQKDSIFYGLNAVTKNMVRVNRLAGDNFNGLIFGGSGSGKSFTAKNEMVDILLNRPNDQVFVIDPQGEYFPLAAALHGERIQLAPGSKYFINPLDLDISDDGEEDTDPITAKSDFVQSMIELMLGQNRTLTPVQKTCIDRVTRKIYRPYIEHLAANHITSDQSVAPTLNDLYQEMSMQPEREAQLLAETLELYATGSFTTFSRRTNVKTHSRFVVYDIKRLGTGMKELGLFVCMNDIYNRMMRNSVKGIYTFFYIDEFHLMLVNDGTTDFVKRIWKMARKWNGVPTGITQNTEELLRNADTRAIFNNTSFVIMLKASRMDRQNLGELLHLSDAQLQYITDSERGHGLIYNGKAVIPFGNDFPKNTELYSVMTTQHDATTDTKVKFA